MLGNAPYGSLICGDIGQSGGVTIQVAVQTVTISCQAGIIPNDAAFAAVQVLLLSLQPVDVTNNMIILAPVQMLEIAGLPATVGLGSLVDVPVQMLEISLPAVEVYIPSLLRLERLDDPKGFVQFSRNPSHNARSGITRYMQHMDGSVDKLFVQESGIPARKIKRISLSNIPRVEREDFMYFLNYVLFGSRNPCILTDIDGNNYTVRVINPEAIRADPVTTGRDSLHMELLIEA
jgi:hypothetical protein